MFLAALVWGILPRLGGHRGAKKETQALNIPTVSVIRPKAGDASQDLVLPGNMGIRRHPDLRTHQRLSQTLDRRHRRACEGRAATGGDRHPEVDDPAPPGAGGPEHRRANFRLAEKTAARWQALLQDRFGVEAGGRSDPGRYGAKKAALDSARFNVARLEKKMRAFRQILPLAA